MLLFSRGGKVEGRKEQKKESGSATAAIGLAAAPRGDPGTGLARCTHPGHLSSGPATASTTSRDPDSAAATTNAAPGLTVLLLPASRSWVPSSGQCRVLCYRHSVLCVNILKLSSPSFHSYGAGTILGPVLYHFGTILETILETIFGLFWDYFWTILGPLFLFFYFDLYAFLTLN